MSNSLPPPLHCSKQASSHTLSKRKKNSRGLVLHSAVSFPDLMTCLRGQWGRKIRVIKIRYRIFKLEAKKGCFSNSK